jgi:hypothetical protein
MARGMGDVLFLLAAASADRSRRLNDHQKDRVVKKSTPVSFFGGYAAGLVQRTIFSMLAIINYFLGIV